MAASDPSPSAGDASTAESAAQSRDRACHDPGLGLLILTSGYIVMSLTDGAAKFLTAELSPGEIVWGRYFFQGMLAVPFVVFATGWRSLVPDRILANIIRGVLSAAGSAMTFISLKVMPLADSVAIFFIQPFLLTILSAIFEREKVGWRRWTAIAVGFCGALVVIQPSFSEFGFYALLPAGSAACFAFYMLLNRRLRDSGSAMSLQAFASLAGMLTITALLLVAGAAGISEFAVVAPTGRQWLILAGIGGFAALGHYFMIVAFRHATAAVLAPTAYVQIISATVIGYLVFGDFPNAGKWVGIAIVVACGIYIFWRETRVRAKA